MAKHICTQQTNIDNLTKMVKAQHLLMFGDVDTGETGLYADIKEMKSDMKDMKPTYKEIQGWSDFFQRGRQVGFGIAMLFTTAGVIFGGLYAIKNWLNK